MKNAIIIDGTVYELVPNDINNKDVCDTCDLYDMCVEIASNSLCVDVHNAGQEEHYIKRQKGGEA